MLHDDASLVEIKSGTTDGAQRWMDGEFLQMDGGKASKKSLSFVEPATNSIY